MRGVITMLSLDFYIVITKLPLLSVVDPEAASTAQLSSNPVIETTPYKSKPCYYMRRRFVVSVKVRSFCIQGCLASPPPLTIPNQAKRFSITNEALHRSLNVSNKHMQMAAPNNSDLEPTPKPQVMYRCKKCRRIVAAEENIVPHERGKGEQCFKWKKRSGDPWDKEPAECSSIFVEPMKWMEAVQEGSVEEKLQCVGCKARLGSFNWAGMQCNCGAWVNPAFQLHKSRLDECHM